MSGSDGIPERRLAIRTIMMPRDVNPYGSIFGGHIMSLIDLAAAEHARSASPKRYLTRVMCEVQFIAPVNVGDVVTFYTRTLSVRNSSVRIRVDVEVERGIESSSTIAVTSAEVVMVAVDEHGRPTPVLPRPSAPADGGPADGKDLSP